MTFNFEDIVDARGNGNVSLFRIYGSDDVLLWERPMTTILQRSDSFLLMVNPVLTEAKRNSNTGSQYGNIRTVNGLTWKYCISPQLYEGTTSGNTTTYDMKQNISEIHGDNNHGMTWNEIGRSISGYKESSSTTYAPAIWQFVKFRGYDQEVFLYSPTYEMIVSKNGGFYIPNWTFTDRIKNGFDWSPYLTTDVFSSSGWTTVELSNTANLNSTATTQNWKYKEIFSKMWPSITVFVPTLTRPDNIATWFTYEQTGEVNSLCMVKPQNSSNLAQSTSIGKIGFIDTINDNVSTTTASGKMIMVLPYVASGWTCN